MASSWASRLALSWSKNAIRSRRTSGREFAQLLKVAVLDLLELLPRLRHPLDALGTLPLDLVRERPLRDPHSVCPHRRRRAGGRLLSRRRRES